MESSSNTEKVILVIDDDPGIRSALENILGNNGYIVVDAKNGRDGLSVLSQAHVDLVITDIFMPSMDGLEFIRAIRKEKSDLKILAMSGGGQMKLMESLDWAKSFGATDILEKPFTHEELLEKIKMILDEDI